MTTKTFLPIIIAILICTPACIDDKQVAGDYPIQPVTFNQVELDDDFWAPRIRLNHELTIPYAFEQSEETTWSRLKRQIEPIMDGILANKGFNSYGVVIDDSTNTDDSKARNEIRGELYIEPTTTGEFIVFGFNILPQGTSFTG